MYNSIDKQRVTWKDNWKIGGKAITLKIIKSSVFSQDANFHLFFFNHKPEDNLQKR